MEEKPDSGIVAGVVFSRSNRHLSIYLCEIHHWRKEFTNRILQIPEPNLPFIHSGQLLHSPLVGSPAHHPVWSTRLCILKHERPGKAALIPSVPRSLAISWVPLLTAFKKCASQKSIFTECCSVLGDFLAILPSLPTPWVPIWEGTVPSPALAFSRTPSFYTLPARGFSTGL